MSSLIQELINDGNLVIWQSYNSGSLRDWSGNGFDGVGTDIEFSTGGAGIDFSEITSLITVTHDSSMQLDDFTIIAEFHELTRSMTNIQRICEKGVNFGLYFSNDLGTISATAGANTATLNYDFRQTKCFGINYLSGYHPIVFSNGVSLGVTSRRLLTEVSANNLIIGNQPALSRQLLNPLKNFLLINRRLTGAEHSEISGELQNLSWPSKVFSHKKNKLYADLSDSSIISAWNMNPIDESIIDRSVTSIDAVLYNKTQKSLSLLGDGIRFESAEDSYAQTPTEAVFDISSGDYTFEFWFRQLGAGSVDPSGIINLYKDGSNFFWIRQFNNTQIQIFNDQGGTGDTALALTDLADSPILNKYHHLVLTKTQTGFKLYIDSILVSDVTFAFNHSASNYLLIIARDASSRSWNGDITKLTFHDEIKDSDWVSARYLEGAKSVAFKTDWGITETISNITSGPIANSNIIASTGSWAVDTEEINGVPAKILTCMVSGIIYIPQSHFHESEEQSAFGTWDYWMNKDTAGNYIVSFGSEIDPSDAGNFRLQSSNTEDLTLIESGVAILATAAGAITPDVWQNIRITRNYIGEFNVYLNGTLVLNATSATAITAKYFSFETYAGSKICLGHLNGDKAITKYLGVVAP